MSQHLAEPIHKYLLKLVQKEDDIRWALRDERVPIPKYEPIKVDKNKKPWGLILSLRP